MHSRKRSSSQDEEQLIKNVLIDMEDKFKYKDNKLSEEQLEKSSTEHESSLKLSKQAVLDNHNLIAEGVSHRRVKGFRVRNQDDLDQQRNVKLTQDILFQGLSS